MPWGPPSDETCRHLRYKAAPGFTFSGSTARPSVKMSLAGCTSERDDAVVGFALVEGYGVGSFGVRRQREKIFKEPHAQP